MRQVQTVKLQPHRKVAVIILPMECLIPAAAKPPVQLPRPPSWGAPNNRVRTSTDVQESRSQSSRRRRRAGMGEVREVFLSTNTKGTKKGTKRKKGSGS